VSSFREQIRAAIGAHGTWKARLRSAIDSGQSTLSVGVTRLDDRCDNGFTVMAETASLHLATGKPFAVFMRSFISRPGASSSLRSQGGVTTLSQRWA
jgi:hypothetical protein